MSVLNSLINIDLAGEQDVFLFSSFENDKKLHIAILDLNKCKAYKGYATEIDLRSQAAAMRATFSDFLSLSTKAFSGKETEGIKFLYNLEKNCENVMFNWKSIDKYETIINIGNIKVIEKEYSSVIKEVFIILSKELSSLNSKISDIEEKLLIFGKEKEDAVKLASEVACIKDQIETELFSKFILVLNQKKDKIRKLKSCNPASKKTKTVKNRHQISDSSDEAVSDIEKTDLTKPSTSKHNVSLPFLDDDNERPIIPSPSKRRIRQNNSGVKKVNFQEYRPKKNPKIIVESESEDELLLNL